MAGHGHGECAPVEDVRVGFAEQAFAHVEGVEEHVLRLVVLELVLVHLRQPSPQQSADRQSPITHKVTIINGHRIGNAPVEVLGDLWVVVLEGGPVDGQRPVVQPLGPVVLVLALTTIHLRLVASPSRRSMALLEPQRAAFGGMAVPGN